MRKGQRIVDAPPFVNAVEHAGRKGITRPVGPSDKLARDLRGWLREGFAILGNRKGDDRAKRQRYWIDVNHPKRTLGDQRQAWMKISNIATIHHG